MLLAVLGQNQVQWRSITAWLHALTRNPDHLFCVYIRQSWSRTHACWVARFESICALDTFNARWDFHSSLLISRTCQIFTISSVSTELATRHACHYLLQGYMPCEKFSRTGDEFERWAVCVVTDQRKKCDTTTEYTIWNNTYAMCCLLSNFEKCVEQSKQIYIFLLFCVGSHPLAAGSL